jgi:hypothetical protein
LCAGQICCRILARIEKGQIYVFSDIFPYVFRYLNSFLALLLNIFAASGKKVIFARLFNCKKRWEFTADNLSSAEECLGHHG